MTPYKEPKPTARVETEKGKKFRISNFEFSSIERLGVYQAAAADKIRNSQFEIFTDRRGSARLTFSNARLRVLSKRGAVRTSSQESDARWVRDPATYTRP